MTVTSTSAANDHLVTSGPDESKEAALSLAAEGAVDAGARVMRSGRSHVGAVVAKGDRDFATAVDLRIESVIKVALAEAAPSIPFLGEEGGGEIDTELDRWVPDPIDGTVNLRAGESSVHDLAGACVWGRTCAWHRGCAVPRGAVHRPARCSART